MKCLVSHSLKRKSTWNRIKSVVLKEYTKKMLFFFLLMLMTLTLLNVCECVCVCNSYQLVTLKRKIMTNKTKVTTSLSPIEKERQSPEMKCCLVSDALKRKKAPEIKLS